MFLCVLSRHLQIVRQGDKYEALVALLKAEVAPDSRTLIFCNKKYLCDEIEKGLWEVRCTRARDGKRGAVPETTCVDPLSSS